MVLKTPMVLTQTHGIVAVLLNHKHTRGTSVARLRDKKEKNIEISVISDNSSNLKSGLVISRLLARAVLYGKHICCNGHNTFPTFVYIDLILCSKNYICF